MERSNRHGPRVDDELDKEVRSLVTGSPVEARIEPGRLKEDAADGEPLPESLVGGSTADAAPPAAGQLAHDEARARSELATYLRPSVFPAGRHEVIACAIEEHAPEATIELLGKLPQQTYDNVAQVWEALGGNHESREGAQALASRPSTEGVPPEPEVPPLDPAVHVPANAPEASTEPDRSPSTVSDPDAHRFGFRFDWRFRLAGKPLRIDEAHAFVEIDDDTLRAHFGPWLVQTPLANITGGTPTGPYSMLKTIGPPHLSLGDHGLTFATNRDEGVCIRFREPVRGIDPLGVIRHPALTVTVDDVDALIAALSM